MERNVAIFKKALIFLKETQNELKKASWPSRQETIRLTVVVIMVSLIVALIIGMLDLTFTNLMRIIIQK